MINLYIIGNKALRSSAYGIGTYINQLELSIQGSGMNVCFIHLNAETQRFSQKVENGVRHWYIPYPKNKYKEEEKHNKLYLQNAVFILRQYIQQTDNLIFHLNYPKYPTFANALKASFNCKIVVAVHFFSWGFDIFGNVSRLQKILGKPEKKLDQLGKQVKITFNEEKNLLCFVDKVLSLSNHNAKILQKIYQVNRQNISIIHNGLEDKAPKEFDRELIRRMYNLSVETPVVIFAGRLDPVKGLSYLIRASKIVLDHFPDCHIVIAGSGDYDTYMKERGNRWMNIHFTGLLEKTELYELYSIADIGVMPSLYEPFGYVAVEMMMHCLPVIATITSGLDEVVDKTCGFKVPVSVQSDRVEIDTDFMAEKILYLLRNPVEARQMGANGRKRYLKYFSSEIFYSKMLHLYKTL